MMFDVLGDEGRKALNACVKVTIYGKPETRKYDRNTSLERLKGCYAGWNRWVHFHEDVLPSDKHGKFKSSYDIVDIHNALVEFKERKCVAKYPREGPDSVKKRKLIDKRRADVERELKEAIADPDSRLGYSWVVAQRRVRDCFAGNFAEDQKIFIGEPKDSYNILDIYEAFVHWDINRQNSETIAALGDGFLQSYDSYVPRETPTGEVKTYLLVNTPSNKPVFLDVEKEIRNFDGKIFQKYPEEGPGADELKKLINEHRADLEKENQKARNHEVSNGRLPEYTRSEAERRVRDCFAGTLPNDTEIFPKKEVDKYDQIYDISDIKNAIDYFDTKTFPDAFKYASNREPGCGKINQDVDKHRTSIEKDYGEATCNTEIEHGSGFIIHNYFIITNKHVIETCVEDVEERHKICISNAVINVSNAEIKGLPCKVAHCDTGKDLALLYCPDLNLEQCGICPLQLSNQSVLPGMSIFAFGYPMSHTGETALFVSGNVSGSKKLLAGHSMIVLNCSLNSGNSGGPVLCWVNGKLKVVGIATQKHIKEILTGEEWETIENIRKSLQTHAIPDMPDSIKRSNTPESDYYSSPGTHQTPMTLLTLKLYDALETHSQFNLSNAVPGHLVVEFVKNSIREYTGEHREELFKVVELANNVVNTS